jgi:hypothetical protein
MMKSVFVLAVGFVMSTFFSIAASAQSSPPFASVQDIPSGELRKSIERLGLSARAETLRQLNSLSPPQADIPYLRAGPSGQLYYVDPPAPPAPPIPPAQKINQTLPDGLTAIISVNPSVAFTLHSRPGAPNVVYLNFRGESVSGTQWNVESRRTTHVMRPYSEDADETTFSQAELNTIAEVWKGISEDYAPFNIDVTTQRPATFGSNVGYILFSNRIDRGGFPITPGDVGGVAYLDVWGQSNFTTFQPALVFPEGVPGAKNLIEAASHELGHNMGLLHDGTSALGYYTGHGSGAVSWAPIMGVGYSANVSQWSKGEYPGANNPQDDVAIITNKLTLRADDHGQTFADATPLWLNNSGVVSSYTPVTLPGNPFNKINRGVISSRTDVDSFVFTVSNAGLVDLLIRPEWADTFLATGLRSADLDVWAQLFRDNGTATGVLVTQSAPSTDTYARVTANVTPGRYLLRIDGAGNGNLTTGYSDYGSLSQYSIIGGVPTPSLRTVAVSTPVPARGVVSGGGNFPVGTAQAVVATANPGFRFVRWTNGGIQVSTSNAFTFVLNSNVSLVAEFSAASAIRQTASR